ncbi:ferredoxin [Pectobacterium cacticida]
MGILIRHEDGYPQLAIEYASCDGCARCISACPTDTLRAQSHFDTGLRPAFSDACVNLIRQCNQCVEACPEQACTLDEKGIPQVENDRCNGCGECQVQCYADAISLIRIPHLAKS